MVFSTIVKLVVVLTLLVAVVFGTDTDQPNKDIPSGQWYPANAGYHGSSNKKPSPNRPNKEIPPGKWYPSNAGWTGSQRN